MEKRVDPSDGCSYSKQEFVDFYGAWAEQRWAAAKPPTGSEDKRKLSACLFLNRGWQEEKHGGSTTIFAFDESTEVGTFRALRLPPEADTLLLYRSDRILYGVERSRGTSPCFSLRTEFIGHYA